MSENVLFQEDFSSSAALCKALQEKIQKARENPPTWSPEIQDMIIAGLFGMTYLPTSMFPIKTIHGTSKVLFILTKDQADVVTKQNVPWRCIKGPAGTGKTWMLILSLQKTYEMSPQTEEMKILVITYNSALKGYIKDTAEKLIPKAPKKKCKIQYFTVDGLKEHLREKMIGKAKARSKKEDEDGCRFARQWEKKCKNLDMEDFTQVFNAYYETVTRRTFHSFKNFGYDAIFIDEAQDIASADEHWIKKLWKKEKDICKLWIFGDEGQNLTRFMGNFSSLLSQKIADNSDVIQTLNKQCRTTMDIYERYHKVRYEAEGTFNDSGLSADADPVEEEEEQEEEEEEEEMEVDGSASEGEDSSVCEYEAHGRTQVHCKKCNVKTSNIRGQAVEEKDVGINYLPIEIVSKLHILIKTERVAAEDIVILVGDHVEKEKLKDDLPTLLIRDGVFSHGTLETAEAEEFAVRCSKVPKRKRKSNGAPAIQKKYLTIDTVRRFKGLEAEVQKNIFLDIEFVIEIPCSPGCDTCE